MATEIQEFRGSVTLKRISDAARKSMVDELRNLATLLESGTDYVGGGMKIERNNGNIRILSDMVIADRVTK